jgi:hypothetical protein
VGESVTSPLPRSLSLSRRAVRLRQHTSAYVGIRRHMSAYVSPRLSREWACVCVCRRRIISHTSAYVCVCRRRIISHTSAYVSVCRRRIISHTSAYVSIRQHTSASVASQLHECVKQHTRSLRPRTRLVACWPHTQGA